MLPGNHVTSSRLHSSMALGHFCAWPSQAPGLYKIADTQEELLMLIFAHCQTTAADKAHVIRMYLLILQLERIHLCCIISCSRSHFSLQLEISK